MGKKADTKSYILEVQGKEGSNTEPLAKLLVERREKYVYDESDVLYGAYISISYRCISTTLYHSAGGSGSFSGYFSEIHNTVSLTSRDLSFKGAVFLDPEELRGHGIGTYFMNEIVQWVKRWPKAEVNSIELLSSQAQPENKGRRNRFYEQFGIVFDYTGPDKSEGKSSPMLAGDLTPIDKSKLNIMERSVFDCLVEIQQLLCEIEDRDNRIKSLTEEYKQIHASPFLWALKTYCRQNVGGVVALGILAVVLFGTAIRG